MVIRKGSHERVICVPFRRTCGRSHSKLLPGGTDHVLARNPVPIYVSPHIREIVRTCWEWRIDTSYRFVFFKPGLSSRLLLHANFSARIVYGVPSAVAVAVSVRSGVLRLLKGVCFRLSH